MSDLWRMNSLTASFTHYVGGPSPVMRVYRTEITPGTVVFSYRWELVGSA